jgi:hypothetical protein
MMFQQFLKMFTCGRCRHRWKVASESAPPARPRKCPSCGARKGLRQDGKGRLSLGSISIEADVPHVVRPVRG